MAIVALGEEAPLAAFGGKGTRLSQARRAGLPVPDGFCLDADALDVVERVRPELEAQLARMAAPAVAVRSSAIGEDGADASFAGIHCSLLNVPSDADAVAEALATVRASGFAPAALEYRRRRGVAGEPRMAAVVQTLVVPRVAGVTFTRDPRSGAERILIDASWGLGEAIVSGLVTPDHWELEPDGRVRTFTLGDKDIAVVPVGRGTAEVPVAPELRARPCLEPGELDEVAELARRCERLFGHGQDVEWVLADGALWLVQSRPITRSASDEPMP